MAFRGSNTGSRPHWKMSLRSCTPSHFCAYIVSGSFIPEPNGSSFDLTTLITEPTTCSGVVRGRGAPLVQVPLKVSKQNTLLNVCCSAAPLVGGIEERLTLILVDYFINAAYLRLIKSCSSAGLCIRLGTSHRLVR
ncbi:hypothetical protein AVEN_195102-1 [Araneus ventricosus]|uniref:Uncharacterized protein n=1 Tax=Araneus ventricosus TaxID=182803 RepID=A0A4Y2BIX1_ARAVE|nr:hypothetical protein AVEN_195102-1 [Araneus ventricosus]